MTSLFELWAGLPWWLRFGEALIFLLASTILTAKSRQRA
jgi:hypothetical protein